MKTLHLVPLHIPSIGIVRQVVSENAASSATGLPWETKIFTFGALPDYAETSRVPEMNNTPIAPPKSKLSFLLQKRRHRKHLYRWLQKNQYDYDLILLRHTYSDAIRARKVRTLGIPTLSVHHTLEVPELRQDQGIFNRLREFAEAYFGPKNIRAASGIVGVTEEITRYEQARARTQLPAYIMPNGTDVAAQPIFADLRTTHPTILFVASEFYAWHGLDRLLDALEHSTRDLTLHVVGKTSHADETRMMKDPRIVNHGQLTQHEISSLAATSWVGLSSFALDRKGMEEACPLKVRDYLAGGLVTYAGHRDVFPSDVTWFRQGPADIDRILDFANTSRSISRESVRDASSPYLDKAVIMQRIHSELKLTYGHDRQSAENDTGLSTNPTIL